MQSASQDTKGIVSPARAFQHFGLERWEPRPPLDRLVDRVWRTSWDLDEPFEQTIVGHPKVNLVFRSDGSASLSGILLRNDRQRLAGRGWALGVMFRPGGFRPLIDHPMSELVDQRRSIGETFGSAGDELADAVAVAGGVTERIQLIATFLEERMPETPTVGEEVSDLIESLSASRAPIIRVSVLARRHGVSTRTLQRLFAEHVGVGPKWVLDRCRVHAAAERARTPVESWADVAHQLGYADQAHLTASVSSTFGVPPATYADREAAG